MKVREAIKFEAWLDEFGELAVDTLARDEDKKWMEIRPTHKGQQQVADLRVVIGDKWPHPGAMDSYVFLVSEVGEVGDALLRSNYGHSQGYVRNHPDKETALAEELGDVYLMLCTLATCLEIDLGEALKERIEHLRGKHG